MKAEVLSPVGNMEMLYAAVNNGCDAVYLGGKSFGARAFANNFTNDELLEVVKYCHLRGVKVYVTVNTLIFNDEVKDFINYINYLDSIRVDALIMQDLGMISLVRELFPNMEVHASTQCHTHNVDGVKFLKSLGIKRVVVARECGIEEIKPMCDLCDIEVFVYGALCVSYSGCCLFSSMNGGRSGNRGECVGNCRMPYTIDGDTAYHLSMQDLNVMDRVHELLDAGVRSLKIEGRMKSPLYVGYVTRLFRKIVDAYENGKKYVMSLEEMNNLRKLFYRGFTYGYLFNDSKLINSEFPNHIGLKIGNVIELDKKYIKVKLFDNLNQGDGIRFLNAKKGMIVNYLYNSKKQLVNKAFKGEVVYLDNKVDLNKVDDVAITLDSSLVIDDIKKLVPVKMKFKARAGEKISLEVNDGINKVLEYGVVAEKSINAPTNEMSIKKQLSKLGETVYTLDELKIDIEENLFIGIKDLNELRRIVLDKLSLMRIGSVKDIQEYAIPVVESRQSKTSYTINVNSEEQLKLALEYDFKRIYVSSEDLYNRYKDNEKIYYLIPRNIKNYVEGLVGVSENGGYINYDCFIANYGVNATNDFTIRLLKKYGALEVCISPEVSIERLRNFNDKINEVLVYGRVELMAIKTNILNKVKGILKDINGNEFPFRYDNYLHIYDCKVLDRREELDKLQGFATLRIDLYEENINEARKIIESVVK